MKQLRQPSPPYPAKPAPLKRRGLTASEKHRVITRQHNKCTACGDPLGNGVKTEFDHVLALALGGSNDLSNFEAIHQRPCHQARTRVTVGQKSKADRQGGGRGSQVKRRKEGKSKPWSWLTFGGKKKTSESKRNG